MRSPLPQKLAHALKYPKTLLSSKSPEDWRLLKPRISGSEAIDLSIAPRWWDIFASAWSTLPERPSPHAVSMASRQPTITEALSYIPPPTAQPTDKEGTRIVLHFKPRREKGSNRNPSPNESPHLSLNPSGVPTPREGTHPSSSFWLTPNRERSNITDVLRTSKNSWSNGVQKYAHWMRLKNNTQWALTLCQSSTLTMGSLHRTYNRSSP